MPATVVVGTQWGDEGKGKLTDLLARECTWSCATRAATTPATHRRQRRGLRAAARAERHPLRPHHARHRQRRRRGPGGAPRGARHAGRQGRRHLPPGRERQRAPDHAVPPGARPGDRALPRKNALGTTKRGIGPAYADKASRVGIRVQDLFDPRSSARSSTSPSRRRTPSWPRCTTGCRWRRPTSRSATWASTPLDRADGRRHGGHGPRRHGQGPRGPARGRPGHLLDLDHGTYPFVTSSNPVAGGACTGSVGHATSIGSSASPRPTSPGRRRALPDRAGQRRRRAARRRGHEFGTNTGRSGAADGSTPSCCARPCASTR